MRVLPYLGGILQENYLKMPAVAHNVISKNSNNDKSISQSHFNDLVFLYSLDYMFSNIL